MAQQSIIEVKERFNGERLEFTCELLAHSDHHAVILYRVQKDGQLADIKLARGTLSLGYYWTDRSYNAYHFVSSQGETLALYCNISDRTQITDAQIYWRDLILDVLITPDGRCRVLDEDELPEKMDPQLRTRIYETTDMLTKQPQAFRTEIEACSREILREYNLLEQ